MPRKAKSLAAERYDPLDQLRALCLALPDASEKIAWGTPTFRLRDKLFAMFSDNHHGDGRVAVWCKAPAGVQEVLVEADPNAFFVPPYVGHNGWIGVRLEPGADWEVVADLIADSYRMTAPKPRPPAKRSSRSRTRRE